MFNPNELVLEKIRAVEEYDPATSELTGRYTQIEEPSLKTSADGTTVTDAMGAEIVTFYQAQTRHLQLHKQPLVLRPCGNTVWFRQGNGRQRQQNCDPRIRNHYNRR